MTNFLRENWLWIAVPFLLAGAFVIWLLVTQDQGTADSAFRYNF